MRVDPPQVIFRHLTFAYADSSSPALVDVNLDVQAGERLVVMGSGGAGKSSLCFAINGVIPRLLRGRYEGSVLVDGQEVGRAPVGHLARHVGLVMQDFESQVFCPTVELELAFGPENLNLPPAEVRRRVERYLSLIGMADLRRVAPARLSGGQKQRLAIGSVMALEPRILVLDEPCTDLDPLAQEEILTLIDQVVARGLTCVMTEHRIESAAKADRICLMNRGTIDRCGAPRQVVGDSAYLKAHGVRPPGLVELFHFLGLDAVPMTCAEARAELLRWRPRLERHVTVKVGGGYRSSSSRVVVSGLTHLYERPPFKALDHLDLKVGSGEFIAIVGANGSGKTTLLKHMAGLLKPTHGHVLIDGKSIGDWSRKDLATRVGYVFQNPDHQIFAETVRSEVGFSLRQFGYRPAEIARRVETALRAMGLEANVDDDPTRLTKGERQRVAIASVLVNRPDVLLLDEPTTGLDYTCQQSLVEVLRELHRKGHTIVMVTHALWLVAEHAERVVVLKGGRILLDGATRPILAQARTLADARLLLPPLVELANDFGLDSLDPLAMAVELRSR